MNGPAASRSSWPEALPEATRLVHIGPHKTGTTAVQQALHAARDVLLEHGVRYAGTESQVYRQAIGLTGKQGHLGDAPPAEEDWSELVREAHAASGLRYVASSESFANARPEHVQRLAADLGPELHVVRMVRRYDKLVTSQWQQLVAAGKRHTFAQYLATVTTDPESAFWRRHGFLPLTERWVDGVGKDRLTVVVVDENDHGWLLRVFERLLALPPGVLVMPPADTNRSFTAAEVEVVRTLNRLRVERAWSDRVHLWYVRRGVSVALRRSAPDPQDGRVRVPPPVQSSLRDRTLRDLDDLERLGVRVVGDPCWLLVPEDDGTHDGAHDGAHDGRGSAGGGGAGATLRVASAARAAVGLVESYLSTGGFPLGGAGAALAAPLPGDRRRPLGAGEQQLVAELRAQPWPEAVSRRFVDRGLVRWLRRSGAGPTRRPTADAGEDRVDARRLALGLTGIIAQTDPSVGRPPDRPGP